MNLSRVIQSRVELRYRREAALFIRKNKKEGRKVVIVTGCFDLFSFGHFRFLEQAKSFGDLLVVGVEDDNRVRGLKNDQQRPFFTIAQRVEVIQGFDRIVDFVFVVKGSPKIPLVSFYSRLHQLLKADILVISGGDPHSEDRRKEIEAAGGSLRILPRLHLDSSTTLLRKVFSQLSWVSDIGRPERPLLINARERRSGLNQLHLPWDMIEG